MNFFVNTVNEPNSVYFRVINEFLILGLYTDTFRDILTYTGRADIFEYSLVVYGHSSLLRT